MAMRRYFLEIAYNGTDFHGWQMQPTQRTVQGEINVALSTISNVEINCVGCGRTDAGVHASQFYLHFDLENELPKNFRYRLNRYLPHSISVARIIETPTDVHARFDATYRAYHYDLHFEKNPFLHDLSYYFPQGDRLDLVKIQRGLDLLKNYDDFSTFQIKQETETGLCQLFRAEFELLRDGQGLRFHIAANRFLRGMIRLIVGNALLLGQGKTTLDDWRRAMETQTKLQPNLSAPACGLYLCAVRYNFLPTDQIYRIKNPPRTKNSP